MPREPKTPKRLCPGGLSYGRRREEHELGRRPDILCYRCKKRLGCSSCVASAYDLICLSCHDWGTERAMERHGPMVKDRERQAAGWKIVLMADAGTLIEEDIDRLFQELFTV